MVESGRTFSQVEYDASLGLPKEHHGAVTMAAQLLRHSGLVDLGVPHEIAMEQLGLRSDDFEIVIKELEQ